MADLGRLGELVDLLAEEGTGVSLMPVQKGMPSGGFGSDEKYDVDGWAVGLFSASGGQDVATAPTISEAVEEAIRIVEAPDTD